MALGIRDWGSENFKYHVEFDKRWCPIEKNKKNKLAGQLGILVRRIVPLTYTDWPHVPLDLIDQIWQDVKVKTLMFIQIIRTLLFIDQLMT